MSAAYSKIFLGKRKNNFLGKIKKENFENLHAVVAILLLFEQFLGKFCSKCFTKYDAFSSYIFHYVCLGRKTYCYRKIQNYGKIVFIINMFENGWWEDASAPARTDNNVPYRYAN